MPQGEENKKADNGITQFSGLGQYGFDVGTTKSTSVITTFFVENGKVTWSDEVLK